MTRDRFTDPIMASLARLVAAKTGLSLTGPSITETGIRCAIERAEVSDASAYLDQLEQGIASLDALIDQLAVPETYFFRNSEHFEIFREVLSEPSSGPDAPAVSVWSAGCSTGEEPYSLAMVAAEADVARPVNILATDISRAALARARQALYRSWSLRGLDEDRLRRYFTRNGDEWLLNEEIRARVTFAQGNLADPSSPMAGGASFDVVFCRNVLIYLDRDAVARAARMLLGALGENGWLVLGPSDPPIAQYGPCETVVLPQGIFYRKRALAEPAPVRLPRSAPSEMAAGADDQAASTMAAPPPVAAGDPAILAAAVRRLANRFGGEAAEGEAQRACQRYPLSAELHLLHGVSLYDLGRDEQAARALRRAIYLDCSQPMAHFLLGAVLLRGGDEAGAWRAYRNAHRWASAMPPHREVPSGDGVTALGLTQAAAAQMRRLQPVLWRAHP
jgi:chemotaxis protein methyltransferase CheR